MATTYSRELLARAEAYEAQALTARRDAQGLTELAGLYAAITGEAVGSCRQCQYSDYRAAVAAYIREATRFFFPDLMKDSKYTFAPAFANETISDGRYNKNVTAENLTDEDAKALLKYGYGHVIVEKGKAEASATDTTTDAGSTEPTEGEKKAQAAAEKATEAQKKAEAAAEKLKQEAADGKKALKAEKDAHAATHKELEQTKKLLADAEKHLTEAQAKLVDKGQADAE